jgi:hypothetical protein
MRTLQRIFAAGIACVSIACAKSSKPEASPVPAAAVTSGVAGRWSGSFKQSQNSSAQLGLSMGTNRGYGSIKIEPVGTGSGQIRIELSISAPVPAGSQIAWALFNGACGSAAPMVTGENRFPPIEIAGSGSGYVRVDMQQQLDSRAAYHANVYWTRRARDLGDVMMCAPLKFEGP